MWSLTGYDSAAHIAEETAGAARAAPIVILVGVAGTEILGWLYYITASYATTSVPDPADEISAPSWPSIFECPGEERCFDPLVLHHSVAGNTFADAHKLLMLHASFSHFLGTTLFPARGGGIFSTAAFNSLASASVIGLYISYATPIYCCITWGKDKLQPGPFNLGVVWVAFMVVMLLFPYTQIASMQTMNYSVVIVMAVFIFAAGSWIFSAKHWFTGPIPNIDAQSDSSSYSEKPDNTEQNSLDI
ncbi:uncharacterized protein EDB91DRAFT_1336572 [Suillus paluster]|uniref:uncharacterized protein n=1 Tax=Suillus paluster TaxID=48578 RepID=UPI001B85D9A2|nr:uncharacterized protein EDB91DRAFT_1336572 [Suillus paluster]KAG1740106.1 hypothetical protein EDB91DRAFT_1336572 [Suillus paluster]